MVINQLSLKTALLSCLPVLVAFILASCNRSNTYQKYSAELDSLNTVLHQSVSNLKKVDSLRCESAILKFKIYSEFLNDNLKDTVPLETAKQLKVFFDAGTSIVKFQSLRSAYLTNSELRSIQLQHLSNDLKQGSVNPEEAVDFINKEKQASFDLIDEMNTNAESLHSNLDLFLSSLPAVEETIRTINSGNLPVVPQVK